MVIKKTKDLGNVIDNVKKIHREDKNNVPLYLDDVKKQNKTKIKEAEYENEFLKYMLYS